MLDKKELASMDLQTIKTSLGDREHLISQMVGTLYPSVLHEEIEQLIEREHELRTTKYVLKYDDGTYYCYRGEGDVEHICYALNLATLADDCFHLESKGKIIKVEVTYKEL